MKKLIMAFAMVLVLVSVSFAAGAYISKISADSKGLTLDSKSLIYMKSTGSTTIAPTTSFNVNSTTSQKLDAATTLELEADGLMTLDANAGLTVDTEGQVIIDGSLSVTTTSAGKIANTPANNFEVDAAKQVIIDGALSITNTSAGKIANVSTTNFEVDSEQSVLLDGAQSVTITSAGAAYYQMVSGAAAASLPKFKIAFGTASSAGAGVNVTFTSSAIFTNKGSYRIFLSSVDAATPINTAENITPTSSTNIDGDHFTLYGSGELVNWMAIGN